MDTLYNKVKPHFVTVKTFGKKKQNYASFKNYFF